MLCKQPIPNLQRANKHDYKLWLNDTSVSRTYEARDRPEIVENPELSIACNSERVNWLMYGLINRGDSDWKTRQILNVSNSYDPEILFCENMKLLIQLFEQRDDITIPMKGLAAALIDSHNVVPIILCKIHPSFMIIHCIAPR